MTIYPPNGKSVKLETASGQEIEIEFDSEDDAILFFEAMKQAYIEESCPGTK